MAILNGTVGMISIDGAVVANLTSCDISLEMSTRETTTKTSAGNKEILEGLMSWSGSGSGFFEDGDTNGYKGLLAAFQARVAVALIYTEYDSTGTTPAKGSEKYTGNIFITSLSRNDGLEDSSTFEVSFEGTGAVTAGVNA